MNRFRNYIVPALSLLLVIGIIVVVAMAIADSGKTEVGQRPDVIRSSNEEPLDVKTETEVNGSAPQSTANPNANAALPAGDSEPEPAASSSTATNSNETLAESGPGEVIALFFGASVVGMLARHWYIRRQLLY